MTTAALSEPAAAEATHARTKTITLAVPGIVCGTCIQTIENALATTAGVEAARANLSLRRVRISYDPDRVDLPGLTAALKKRGYEAAELSQEAAHHYDRVGELLPRVGVAGFAAANIMLLSVSVWSGQDHDMETSVQALFHRLSGLIAIPAIAYAGQPFFKSALGALRARRLNMDVPISLGILLATAMSFYQTYRGTEHVYFDAAITLVFFLLIGRTLDEQMRSRATGAAANLLSLKAISATVLGLDGQARSVASRDLKPGDHILIGAGERIAADGVVIKGASEIDESLITGETVPRYVDLGERVHAGTINGGQPIEVEVLAADEKTLLAEIARIMAAAEQDRGLYVRLADRAARFYAPAVHILGLSTFIGWMLVGGGWEQSLTNAIAVLIITCPCALALAVPAVQVAATSRLFRNGIIVKAADGLERIAETGTIVLDKTGTLTTGHLQLVNSAEIRDEDLRAAASLAVASLHPYARAVVAAARARKLDIKPASGVQEVPGSGLEHVSADGVERLGSWKWVEGPGSPHTAPLYFRPADGRIIAFNFQDQLRADAAAVIATLKEAGYRVELLSGDQSAAVAEAAQAAGIDAYRGGARPDEKLARLNSLKRDGERVLMIGDGLNDAPALVGGHASLSPASALEISQTASDAVFQGEVLSPVIEAIAVARAAQRLALQNFLIAIGYNIAFVPLAALGHVTPLIAAVAMSTSSILVTANAVRLRNMRLKLGKVPRKRSPL